MWLPGEGVPLLPSPDSTDTAPVARAALALTGLSVGDAFGEKFFIDPDLASAQIRDRVLPEGPWRITDDTVMACGVYEALHERGMILPDSLMRIFVRNYRKDPARGYGGGAHRLMQRTAGDGDWFRHATALFGGEGSFGNGGAMRVAPLGAFLADDLKKVRDQANASAIVTHAHPEGRAGAVAVAVAAAVCWRNRADPDAARAALYETCLEHTPAGRVRDGIERARNTPADASVHLAVQRLGNGREISAADTVPFSLWAAHRHLDDYREAMWATVSALGDRDTTCAIVGGLVALVVGRDGIPDEWVARREGLAGWLPGEHEA